MYISITLNLNLMQSCIRQDFFSHIYNMLVEKMLWGTIKIKDYITGYLIDTIKMKGDWTNYIENNKTSDKN
jgi:hypothetical protein